LTETHAALRQLAVSLARKMEKTQRDAAETKKDMASEASLNFVGDDEALETYAQIAAMNRIIDGYNIAQSADAEKLSNVQLLLRQPYFAKVVLQFKSDEEPKELYIGNAGVSDENCRRMVVDWRSPVAETYYNQENGRTSYIADGRTITAELKLRRQFDLDGARLNDYFDTTVAIQDALLLASLSRGRTAQLQAITATIQKEQNLVVRHEDVPALLVTGIAGSGKTSVLMQRIAYLFYRHRAKLDPREVFLISPNPLFGRYIENVLPDLGERNPETLTFEELLGGLLPAGTGKGSAPVTLEALSRIDRAAADFDFLPDDFRDLCCEGTRLLAAAQIRKVSDKYARIPAGPHRATLIREELRKRLNARLKQMAGTERAQNEMYALSIEEQIRIFHETIDPQNEREEQALTLRYLNDRYAEAFAMVEHDDWLHIDRIGMRLLNVPSLLPMEWLYLKMAVTGLCNADAKYVMIDEAQDYTAAQLAVLARYFRRAHFMLLGDPNQAIDEGTATFDEIRRIFGSRKPSNGALGSQSPRPIRPTGSKAKGAVISERSATARSVVEGGHAAKESVAECRLMTSYRSSPEITALFARLADKDACMQISSIQRAGSQPLIHSYANEEEYVAALHAAVDSASTKGGLTAIIVPWKQAGKHVQRLLANAIAPAIDTPQNPASSEANMPQVPIILGEHDALPSSGTIIVPLKLAKGLEFDRVIIPDASDRAFPANDLARRRLYTTISRATHEIVILAKGELSPLLQE
ncbi:MAG: AAA family ATPase, partial [Eggerthellaceae bacterium]|nr:AAA family ATPase [Eggerthellaceae bacterium]